MAQRLMRAAVLKAKGRSPVISVEEIPIPEPKPGEVVVRIDSSPINPSDLSFIGGWYAPQKPIPSTPGFEGSGTVVASGSSDFSQSLLGKRVACKSMLTSIYGCWAEYLLTSADLCFSINDDVTLEEASCFFVNPLTVVMFLKIIQEGGHQAVIQNAAASALGKMLIKSLKRLNIPIINIVRRQEQVDALTAIGAEYVLNSSQEGFTERLHELSQQLNPTVAFDAIAGESTGVVFSAIQPGGTVYLYGSLSGTPSSGLSSSDLIGKSKTLTGAWVTGWFSKLSPEKAHAACNTVQDHIKTDLRSEVASRFSIDSVPEAIAFYKASMSAGKTLIKP